MAGSRMIEKWVWADLKWVLGQPKKLFIHALSPEVRVPDSGRNDNRNQDGGGDSNPWFPLLRGNLAIRRQRRNFRQHWKLSGIHQIRFAADPVVEELGS